MRIREEWIGPLTRIYWGKNLFMFWEEKKVVRSRRPEQLPWKLDGNDCHRNNRNSYHGNLDITSYLKDGALWKMNRLEVQILTGYITAKASVISATGNHIGLRFVTAEMEHSVMHGQYSTDTEKTQQRCHVLSPEEGRKNPMGVLSPGEHTRISPLHPREELPLAPCQCDNEHCGLLLAAIFRGRKPQDHYMCGKWARKGSN